MTNSTQPERKCPTHCEHDLSWMRDGKCRAIVSDDDLCDHRCPERICIGGADGSPSCGHAERYTHMGAGTCGFMIEDAHDTRYGGHCGHPCIFSEPDLKMTPISSPPLITAEGVPMGVEDAWDKAIEIADGWARSPSCLEPHEDNPCCHVRTGAGIADALRKAKHEQSHC